MSQAGKVCVSMQEEFVIPEPGVCGGKMSLSKPLSAIQLMRSENGRPKLGLLTQLGPGITVERCGEGFNERTLMVRTNGQHYFVFLQDLELQAAAAQ
jgi:hypothetical protein